jgi:triacylglycerol esterase/lipase EstA (alpha/beta hydrolase family)
MTESLLIKHIRRCYTEDMIIDIFWKNGLGKVYRVDFEAIVYDNGDWNFDFQRAFVYKDETTHWDSEFIESLEKYGLFILDHTTFNGETEQFKMYKNPHPIPRTTTTRNIHQLDHINRKLMARIRELENENNVLNGQVI